MSENAGVWTDEHRRMLIEFLDWLLDPTEWPRLNTEYKRDLRRWRKAIHSALDALPNDYPRAHLARARFHLEQEIVEIKRELSGPSYTSPSMSTGVYDPSAGLGNIERDRRLFVAWLIFKKAHYDPVLRRQISPTRNHFLDMEKYALRKGYEYEGKTKLLGQLADKAVRLYRKKRDFAPPEIVGFVYSHYAWAIKHQSGYSEGEKMMLLELTAR